SIDHFRRIHGEACHRVFDGEWEIMPGPFVEHYPMPRGKDEATQIVQTRNDFARSVIGLAEHHRKRLVSPADEKVSHFQMPFKPDDMSISPGNTRRAHNGGPGALERDVVPFLNRTFIE